MIGPGLGRMLVIFGGVPFPVAVSIVLGISAAVALLLLMFDMVKKVNVRPFLTIFLLVLVYLLCWLYQMSAWWQGFAVLWAKLFF